MDFGLLDALLHWFRANPAWGGAAVMAVAFGESLALVGLFLPGALLMFGIGALVGAGVLPLWPTLAWAAAGAIAGDGVSFWLGRHFHQRLRTMWPLRSHPELLAQATDFLYRHGGKSVLLGRFVGPIRPVIPLVAGMLDMSVHRFVVANVVSGLLWAPLYILPGMVFAASLGLAAEVATRLALLLGSLLLLLIAVLWLTRRLFELWHRHAYRLLRYSLGWAQRHPRLGQLPAALLDPAHPEARGLTLLGLLLLMAGTTLWWTLQALSDGPLPDLDEAARQGLQALRTPWADAALLPLAALAAPVTLIPLFAAVLLWLGWRRHWLAAGHWLAAALFAALFALLLQLLPTGAGAEQPVLFAAVLYGFLVVLLGCEVREHWRWLAYAGTALLLVLLGFARLYLGSQSLSEVLLGLSLGLLWATLLGIAWLHHPAARPGARPLLLVTLAAVLGAGLWYRANCFDADVARHALPPVTYPMDAGYWQRQGWAELPAERDDIHHRRRHPLTVQYAGPLDTLRRSLQEQGWQPPVTLDALSWLRWLNLAAAPEQLPVLPQVHAGHHQQFLLIKAEPGGQILRVLRLWPSGRNLQPGDVPLWVGNTAWLETDRLLGSVAVPRTMDDFVRPLQRLRGELAAAGWNVVTRQRAAGDEVILLRR